MSENIASTRRFMVMGKVKEISTRHRFYFFPRRYLLVDLDLRDIARIQQELDRQFPDYGSLKNWETAVPLSRVDDPSKYQPGTTVQIVFSVSNPLAEYFLGQPRLGLDSISPIPSQ